MLEIFSPENRCDNQLNKLYIENYSNTEFVSEADVYSYMSKVHDFLIKYRNFDFDCMIYEDNHDAKNLHIRTWKIILPN